MTTKPEFETLLFDKGDHTAVITLNRPQVHNALNRRGYADLQAAFEQVEADEEIRCAIITGSDPSFCSGDDVRELMVGEEESRAARPPAPRPRTTPAAATLLEMTKPVIAAVNGAAVGWGMELTLFADIRIASEKARFGELFVKRGLVSDVGGLMRLPEVVGASLAAEILFTGEIVDAQEAARIGLVSRVVPHDQLLDAARDLAGRIAANPPLAVRFLKEGLRRGRRSDLHDMGAWVGRSLSILFQTEDHREGVAAFLEKRAPVFRGR